MVLVQIGSTTCSFGTPRAHDACKDMVFRRIAMLVAGSCSTFAGVYIEAVRKTSEKSFMVCNAQPAAYTCLRALDGLVWQSDLLLHGFLRDYTVLV